jgi:hypothetical protein
MKQALAALVGSSATLCACYGLGAFLLGRAGVTLHRMEKLFLSLVAGASVLHLAVFALLALHLAYWPLFVLLLAASVYLAVQSGDWRMPKTTPGSWPKSLAATFAKYCFPAIAVIFFLVYFVNAWAPERSPDGSGYHLGLIARYLRAHGFERVATNLYSNLSAGMEMLYVPAFSIGRHSAAALVHLGFLVACSLGIFAYGMRAKVPLVGASAGLIFFASPVVGIDGSTAYIDVGAAAAAFAVFCALEIWDAVRNPRMLLIVGLLAGYCYAVKYTVGVMVIYAIGFVLLRSKRLGPAVTILSGVLVMIMPWVLKNVIYSGNPISPFGNRYFPNPYVTIDFERGWRAYLANYNLKNLWDLPWDVTARGQFTQGVIGIIFLAAPLALLGLKRQTGRRLLAAAGLVLIPYFANVGARFLIPALPFVSLAMLLPFQNVPPLLAFTVLAHSILSWPPVLHRVSPGVWSITGFPLRAALRFTSPEEFLGENVEYRRARMIEQYVPKDAKVLAFSGVPDAYTSREVVVSFQSAFGSEMAELVYTGLREPTGWSRLLMFKFPEQKIRHIRLVQMNRVEKPEDQWDIQEIQFFSKGKRITREQAWILEAYPFPWASANAIDDSLVTRWQTWETAGPGQYFRVDFGSPQSVDGVHVYLLDAWSTKMQLEIREPEGQWKPLQVRLEESSIPAPDNVHKLVVQALHSRGVDFVLFKNGDYGADRISSDPESFGLKLLAHGNEASLYQVKP